MKHSIALIFSLFLFSCQSEKNKQPEALDLELSNTDLYQHLENEGSSKDQNYQVALDFLNAYIENNNNVEILEFVKGSSLVTESLKEKLENMLIRAWEENPQVGLGFDPILDAQDYPHKGVELHEFDLGTGYVTVKGIDWDDFKMTMTVVTKNGHILVDGCGVVNIPEDKRAEI